MRSHRIINVWSWKRPCRFRQRPQPRVDVAFEQDRPASDFTGDEPSGLDLGIERRPAYTDESCQLSDGEGFLFHLSSDLG